MQTDRSRERWRRLHFMTNIADARVANSNGLHKLGHS